MNEQHTPSELLDALCNELELKPELSSASPEEAGGGSEVSSSAETDATGSSVRYTETQLSDDAVDSVRGWIDNEYLQQIENKHVIAQLDEIILLLIATRGKASGKELCQDLQRLFGADLSPGTVYPRLTDLREDGLLDMHELTRRKVYSIADSEQIDEHVAQGMDQLLTFSLVLKLLTVESAGAHTHNHGGSE